MGLLDDYREAQGSELVARLRRAIALRALLASGESQREIAEALGISQLAISQQLRFQSVLETIRPDVLLYTAAPALKSLATEGGYERLAVFGSCARGDAREDSDIDLLVDAPPGTSSFDFIRFRQSIERVLGRKVDLISYGGLRPALDDDVRRDAVLL